MAPLVTVLMPCYNAAPFLREAIDSILNQTYSNFIFLIIDDGSTDNSVGIISEYSDQRIRLIRNENNLRLVATLNRGLDLIQTKYMVRMDADDISKPDRIEKLVNFMENNPDIGVCGSAIQVFGKLEEIWMYDTEDSAIKSKLFFKSIMPHASSIFRMDFLIKSDIKYSEKYIYMEDLELWSKIYTLTKFSNLSEPLYNYRILDHNVTEKNRGTLHRRVTDFFYDFYQSMNIEFSKTEVSLVLGFGIVHKATPENITKYRQLLSQLQKEGNRIGIFDSLRFDGVIKERWDKAFYYSVDAGFRSFLTYSRFGFFYSLEKWRYLGSKFIFRKR